MEMKQHPLSAAFPAMSADDFQALKDDIDNNGQREPVMVFEGMILDGWHRYRACVELGMKPHTITFPADGDPVALVKTANLHRRHLTGSQRTAAIVACAEWHPPHRTKKVEATSTLPKTNKEIAKEAGVSVRTVTDTKTAKKAGLLDAVRDGAMTATEAAQVSRGKTESLKSSAPAEDFGPSEAEIANAQRDQEEELASLRRIAESDDKLKAAMAEVKRFQEENRILKERINSLLNEKNAAIRAAKSWQRKAEATA